MNRTYRLNCHCIKALLIFFVIVLYTINMRAQADSTFCGKFIDAENNTYLVLDLDSQKVIVPGQEFFGEMAGYLGQKNDSRLWFITSADRISKDKAKIYLTNDYGSEDLEATLVRLSNGNICLKQGSGSRIKIVVNRKWQKLPNEIIYVPDKTKKAIKK